MHPLGQILDCGGYIEFSKTFGANSCPRFQETAAAEHDREDFRVLRDRRTIHAIEQVDSGPRRTPRTDENVDGDDPLHRGRPDMQSDSSFTEVLDADQG